MNSIFLAFSLLVCGHPSASMHVFVTFKRTSLLVPNSNSSCATAGCGNTLFYLEAGYTKPLKWAVVGERELEKGVNVQDRVDGMLRERIRDIREWKGKWEEWREERGKKWKENRKNSETDEWMEERVAMDIAIWKVQRMSMREHKKRLSVWEDAEERWYGCLSKKRMNVAFDGWERMKRSV